MGAAALGADALLLLTALIWGFAFVAQRVGMKDLGPFAFNAARYLVGTLSLLPLVFLRRRASSFALSSAYLPSLAAGACMFLGASFQQAGLVNTTAGNAAFVTSLYVVIVPLIGMAFGKKVGLKDWGAAAVAVAGLYLITVGENFRIAPGDFLELGGAFFWALHIIVIGRFAGKTDSVLLSAGQFAVCGLLSLGAALILEPKPFQGIGGALIPIAYGGLLSCGVAFTLQIVAQRTAKPAHASIILALEGLFGALGGILILGEPFGLRIALGGALMLGAAILSQAEPPPGLTSGRPNTAKE